jgi:hypothetical protein
MMRKAVYCLDFDLYVALHTYQFKMYLLQQLVLPVMRDCYASDRDYACHKLAH